MHSSAAITAGAQHATPSASSGGAKLWGGRFTGATDPLMEAFNNSISFDRRLWRVDIDGSVEYARALSRCGILTVHEADTLVDGLQRVRCDGAQCDVSANYSGGHNLPIIVT